MKKISLVALLFSSIVSFGQISFKGVITDTLKNPLELASLVAINKETNGFESYVITDDLGQFKLDLKENTRYNIQISYIGLQTINDNLSTSQINLVKDYVLKAEFALDEVELVYKMPVAIKGDTLVYNADAYKNGSERKLEDIIEKLPGVEINESGQIEVEGKVVNKLMVNGKDFFDGDTKIATKNIPSNAVDKIQVLRNYAEVGQLSSVRNNQDNVAINIKLKEGKESFWFGNVTAGTGSAPDETLYLAQPKLFYYSPKYSINFIADLNNIGEVALSRRDIRGFGGGFNAPSRNSGTSINLGDNSLNFLTNQGNARKIENKLATANFSYSPNKVLDLSGFLIFNNSKILSREVNFVQYSNPDLNIPDESTEQDSNERSNQGLVKLSASYKPNFNKQIDYDVLARMSDDKQQQSIFSSVIGNTNQTDEVTPYNINQNLKYYYTLDEDNIFAFESQHVLKNEDPIYNAILDNIPNVATAYTNTANALGLNTSLSEYNLGQNRRIKS
ncbi:carboxypeptidase-like regulatory domain-containing protein, partial [Flavobacteriaceae bacterium]|nr:carboxypeptidase-like regulatory domain-containing protein [Flavobacteriaceae bacterium]